MTILISDSQEQLLISTIEDWSICHGLSMRSLFPKSSSITDGRSVLVIPAPITLFPSPFPRICFNRAHAIQRKFNRLYASISQDEEFLRDLVEEIIDVDDFIANLWNVHLKVKEEGYSQDLSLGVFRSDYMVYQSGAESEPSIKQVEFNTIASSYCGLSSRTSELHRFLAKHEYNLLNNYDVPNISDLPYNKSLAGVVSGLQTAFNEYSIKSPSKNKFCIIFLVQDTEKNVQDQRLLEYALKELEPSITVFRLTFSEILKNIEVRDSPKRELLYYLPSDPSMVFEVAVVYFRAGYGPSDYPEKSAWNARLQIERSNAIKCPSILTQLAGSKKVQQILATPTTSATPLSVSRFIQINDGRLSKIKDVFTVIFPLDNSPAGLEAQRLATDCELCKDYVLKPQREGGGNNVYRLAIPGFLRSLPKDQWKCYILMKIIATPPVQNLTLRNGSIEKGGVISELGVYGVCLWNHATTKTLYNEESGYLLRTKGDTSEEGGVTAGYGCMDSCRLI